jgi:AraC-like DNA-binding protein
MALPAPALRPYVSHYWLSLDNRDASCAVTPDGAVDLVAVAGRSAVRVDLFGTTTRRTALALDLGCHYLGIRFRPGQSRHFLDVQARELTDAVLPAEGAMVSSLLAVTESMTGTSPYARLDALLLAQLARRPPVSSRIDEVLRYMAQSPGPLRMSELADLCCKSRRQFERNFLDVAGLSAKLYAEILRFRRAATLLAGSSQPLAQIAAALGYTDQSHFSHEFSRFYGMPPSRARANAAFLQDLP